MDQANNYKYDFPFELLTEEASQDDLFENESHRNLANSIFKIIHNTESGINIGLHGDYGSGKTTVTSLLQTINSDHSTKYFYFDSWAHRDDPLRKVFLEELSNALIDDEKYKQKTKTWLRSSVSTEITKLKSYQKSARIKYLIASPFIALGIALFLKNDFNEICMGVNCGPLNLNFSMGLLLIFVPILISVVSHFRYLKKEKGKSYSEVLAKFSKYFNPNIFLGNEKGITKTKSESLTSLEFRDKFIEIISEWKKSNQNSKLVFIIDNLDRVDHEASSILSSLQLFFQHRNGIKQDAEIYKKIYVLIPHNNTLGKMDLEEYIEFKEKFFQVSFDIPQPLPMNWDKIFDKFFEKCFKNHPSWIKTKTEIKEVYNFFHQSVDSAFNPRLIKSYLNQIAILKNHLIEKNIPIKYICYYSLLRKNKTDKKVTYDSISQDLQNAKYPLQQHLHFLLTEELNTKQEVIEVLAAIHFNVTKNHSYEILLNGLIGGCLFDSRKKESNELSELEEKHGNSFWYVFDNCIEGIDTNNFINASYVISNNFEKNNQKADTLRFKFNSLSYQSLNDERIFLSSEDLFKQIFSVFGFLNRTNQEQLWRSIIRQFCDQIRKEVDSKKLELAIDNNENLYSTFNFENVKVERPLFNLREWQIIAKYWHIKSPNLIKYLIPEDQEKRGSGIAKMLTDQSLLGEENLMVIKYFVKAEKVGITDLHKIYIHFIQSYSKQKLTLEEHSHLSTLAYFLTVERKSPDFFSINGFEKYLLNLWQNEEKENKLGQVYLLNFTLSVKYSRHFFKLLQDSSELKRRLIHIWLDDSKEGLDVFINYFIEEIEDLTWLYSFFEDSKFELAYQIAEEYIERGNTHLFKSNFKIEQIAFLSLQLWRRKNVSMSKYFLLLKNVRDISKVKEEVLKSDLTVSQKESFQELLVSEGI
jgi:hypothetical protein